MSILRTPLETRHDVLGSILCGPNGMVKRKADLSRRLRPLGGVWYVVSGLMNNGVFRGAKPRRPA